MKSWTSLTTHASQTQSTVMSSVSKGTSYKGQVVCLPGSYCKMVVRAVWTVWWSFLSVTTCLFWQSGTQRSGDSSTWAQISSWKTQDVPCLAPSWSTRWQLTAYHVLDIMHSSLSVPDHREVQIPSACFQSCPIVWQWFYSSYEGGGGLLLRLPGGGLWGSAGALHWLQLHHDLGLDRDCFVKVASFVSIALLVSINKTLNISCYSQ